MAKNHIENWTSSRIKVFIRTSIITVILIAVLLGVGFLFDNHFESGNIAKIIALAVGFPLTQFIIFKSIKSYSKQL